ncbi:TPA: hypothetical protein N0F65_006243 [Lagenidium giganteum]|uniref:BED-type domain-containing protein n=1 Tax=Lagenidium giganteum TaxID=4803 RepID=A0AAV2Z2Q4_9STRA|nr:TPA: hypothetical protein N0F65_006243 [Lagenidium giganteum]
MEADARTTEEEQVAKAPVAALDMNHAMPLAEVAAVARTHATDTSTEMAAAAGDHANTLFENAVASSYNAAAAAVASGALMEPQHAATGVGVGVGSSITDTTATTAMSNSFIGATTGAPELFGHVLEAPTEDKKTGRPSHPAWEHFVRGEKRNRFHHHAYCRYCAANGVEAIPIRGVSGNMIRHLQRCQYCPSEVVTHLKVMCAQKDAENFSKRHQSVSGEVDALLNEHNAAAKKLKRTHSATATSPSTNQARTGTLASSAGSAAASTAKLTDEEFMQLQLPLLQGDVAAGLRNSTTSGKGIGMQKTPQARSSSQRAKTPTAKRSAAAKGSSLSGSGSATPSGSTALDMTVLKKLIVTSSISADLPWDWVWFDETAQMLAEVNSSVAVPSRAALYESELLASVGMSSREKQQIKMKDEPVGVTLAINMWTSLFTKKSVVLFSLVNALGEASAHSLVELRRDECTTDELCVRIKACLSALQQTGTQVINITADTTLVYAAARLIAASSDSAFADITVAPCFSQFLVVLLGAVLTASEALMGTMGDVIDLVQVFSNDRVMSVFRRECGDSEATLVLPRKDHWFSFIECIDSVRQFEDMIKIIASKALSVADADTSSSLRKDSTGNSLDDLKDMHFTPAMLHTIQNQEFWDNVVALSELMAPLKETHKLMASTPAPFSLSDILYQLGRMHQQYGGIMADCEDNAFGQRILSQVRFLRELVNKMWRLYDQNLAFVSYVFNYNMMYPYLARNQPSLQWLSVGKYAKDYFRRWFCTSARSHQRISLPDDTATQFLEDVLAYKERKYPFDAESICEFENPRSFYLFISDSNPLMHVFGARLFSMNMSTPSLSKVVQGITFIPSAAEVVQLKEVLLPVLQIKLFAQTAIKPSKEVLALIQSGRVHSAGSSIEDSKGSTLTIEASCSTEKKKASLLCGVDTRASSNVWNKKQWTALATHWRAHWQREMGIDNIMQELALIDASVSRFSPALTIDQVFKEKLPSRLPQDREEAVVDV